MPIMKKTIRWIWVGLLLLPAVHCSSAVRPALSDAELDAKAKSLAQDFIIVDTHVDVPYRLEEKMEDISQSTEDGNFDYPRAKAGGLDAPFMSIYIPASYQETGGAKDYADHLIDMVEGLERDHPDQFAVARSVSDLRKAVLAEKIALPMGMENGAPIEGDLENLRHFYQRGIRYITLTHAKSNHICDSSYDDNHQWEGLSPFGREVVAEMNRLGIMVDVSHISDQAFDQVMELAKAPVIASHSSCRHFTPGWERNMSDEMIKKLGANGGVIQINFGSDFLSGDYHTASEARRKAFEEYRTANDLEEDDQQAKDWLAQYNDDHPLRFADVSNVADHIDHVRALVGIEHIGLGSDFDGVGDTLPTGLKDVSQYPNVIRELLKRGYTVDDIEKILSGNLLRVWSEVERIAAEAQSQTSAG